MSPFPELIVVPCILDNLGVRLSECTTLLRKNYRTFQTGQCYDNLRTDKRLERPTWALFKHRTRFRIPWIRWFCTISILLMLPHCFNNSNAISVVSVGTGQMYKTGLNGHVKDPSWQLPEPIMRKKKLQKPVIISFIAVWSILQQEIKNKLII